MTASDHLRSAATSAAVFLLAGIPRAALAQGAPVRGVSESLSYLNGFGPKAYPVVSLLWGEIVLALAVTGIIALLVLGGCVWRGRRASLDMRNVPLRSGGPGLAFIYVGIGITFVVLVGFAVWNYFVLTAIAGPRHPLPVTAEITGHQWWWEVRYHGRGPNLPGFVTANELHIPVGTPVKIVLHTADVIHSFWVPKLAGKMDTIPGQNNTTWIQADKAGVYRGQCTEYCGQQHAHMGFVVTAEPPRRFDEWWRGQQFGPDRTHARVGAEAADQGQIVFMRHCAVCHTVRGTLAQGKIGPDLSHLMQRKTLAAATLPNTPGYLSGWISNPQHIKPGNAMPSLDLSPVELASLRSFLETLQ